MFHYDEHDIFLKVNPIYAKRLQLSYLNQQLCSLPLPHVPISTHIFMDLAVFLLTSTAPSSICAYKIITLVYIAAS